MIHCDEVLIVGKLWRGRGEGGCDWALRSILLRSYLGQNSQSESSPPLHLHTQRKVRSCGMSAASSVWPEVAKCPEGLELVLVLVGVAWCGWPEPEPGDAVMVSSSLHSLSQL